MSSFTKESLELLRNKIDLVEVLSSHIQLKRSGVFYKALCPFHEEKTPSFVIQKADGHYHCYGCGAHGDAISFLMNYLKMGFLEAVEYLAERFHVSLEKTEKKSHFTPKRAELKSVCEKACRFFQFSLLHTKEGQSALSYLFERGMTLDFIKTFRLGFALNHKEIFRRYMHDLSVKDFYLLQTGLLTQKNTPFFYDRITIPITDPMGSVIAFSARKTRESTFGPKYINSPETSLFKKSKTLFGLSFARKKIIKEKRAIVVEGQLDCLRLIFSGFSNVIAAQGTAFGVEHVQELIHLGVRNVFLAFDSDKAGKEATLKVGDLFQKEGIEVQVVKMPKNLDPDDLIKEKGPKYFEELLKKSVDYLTFLIEKRSEETNLQSPAHKSKLVETIATQIKSWDHPLMVHESIRKLARLTQTPESFLHQDDKAPNLYLKKSASISHIDVNADRVLEADLLRWLFLMGESSTYFINIAKINLTGDHFRISVCKNLFQTYLELFSAKKPKDLLSLTIELNSAEEQLFLAEMLQKRVDKEKAEELFVDTVQKILDRHWMEKREEIKEKILSGKMPEEKALELAKEFDKIKKSRPMVKFPSSDESI